MVIPCAGEARRWGDHLGVPKQLVEVDGEPILHRTVRLARAHGAREVFVVARRGDDPAFQVPGAETIAARFSPAFGDSDTYASSRHVWSPSGPTRIILGDVYFTEAAMALIMERDVQGWTWFCRMHRSEITGSPWGEGFAVGFRPEDRGRYFAALCAVTALFQARIIRRTKGWEVARYMGGARGAAVGEHRRHECFVEIDDETNDFDRPVDYEAWMERRRARLAGASCSPPRRASAA